MSPFFILLVTIQRYEVAKFIGAISSAGQTIQDVELWFYLWIGLAQGVSRNQISNIKMLPILL